MQYEIIVSVDGAFSKNCHLLIYFRMRAESPLEQPLMWQFRILSRGCVSLSYTSLEQRNLNADRTIWPLGDNADITSRYHSSADKEIACRGRLGDVLDFGESFIRTGNGNRATHRQPMEIRRPDVKEVVPLKDILYVFVGSGRCEGDFFPVRVRGSGLFIHTRIFAPSSTVMPSLVAWKC